MESVSDFEPPSSVIYSLSRDFKKNTELINTYISSISNLIKSHYETLYGIDFIEPQTSMITISDIHNLKYPSGKNVYFVCVSCAVFSRKENMKVTPDTDVKETAISEFVDEALLIGLMALSNEVKTRINTDAMLEMFSTYTI